MIAVVLELVPTIPCADELHTQSQAVIQRRRRAVNLMGNLTGAYHLQRLPDAFPVWNGHGAIDDAHAARKIGNQQCIYRIQYLPRCRPDESLNLCLRAEPPLWVRLQQLSRAASQFMRDLSTAASPAMRNRRRDGSVSLARVDRAHLCRQAILAALHLVNEASYFLRMLPTLAPQLTKQPNIRIAQCTTVAFDSMTCPRTQGLRIISRTEQNKRVVCCRCRSQVSEQSDHEGLHHSNVA
jgi:hypothetical protein